MQININIESDSSQSKEATKLFMRHLINNTHIIFIFNLHFLFPDRLIQFLQQLLATLPHFLLPLRLVLILFTRLFCDERSGWLLHWVSLLRHEQYFLVLQDCEVKVHLLCIHIDVQIVQVVIFALLFFTHQLILQANLQRPKPRECDKAAKGRLRKMQRVEGGYEISMRIDMSQSLKRKRQKRVPALRYQEKKVFNNKVQNQKNQQLLQLITHKVRISPTSFILHYLNIFSLFMQQIHNMITSAQRQNSDSLDQASQQYARLKSGYSSQEEPNPGYRHDIMLKNLYKQELDELMRQKNQQKRMEKQREIQERQLYNDRANFSRQADKMKDLAYKNYYQMLLNNQNNIAKNHIQLNYQRDNLKDKLITSGLQEEKIRSEQWWQAEQRRRQEMKKHYREDLDKQMHEKQFKNVHEAESKMKQQQQFKKITFAPDQVAKYQRERKVNEMNKYKQDLDRVTPLGSEKYKQMAGSTIVNSGKYTATNNDFNIYQQKRHDPMTNPMPFNIQNPYILRQFMRKEQLKQSNPQQNIFSPK